MAFPLSVSGSLLLCLGALPLKFYSHLKSRGLGRPNHLQTVAGVYGAESEFLRRQGISEILSSRRRRIPSLTLSHRLDNLVLRWLMDLRQAKVVRRLPKNLFCHEFTSPNWQGSTLQSGRSHQNASKGMTAPNVRLLQIPNSRPRSMMSTLNQGRPDCQC